MDKKLQKISARDVAKNLIRAYVLRGDDEGQLRRSMLVMYGPDCGADVHGDKIYVCRVEGKDVQEVFSLPAIIKEIKQEQVQSTLFQ